MARWSGSCWRRGLIRPVWITADALHYIALLQRGMYKQLYILRRRQEILRSFFFCWNTTSILICRTVKATQRFIGLYLSRRKRWFFV
ncbi:hypothetical protein BDW69DRAFT_169777 [Aspergillus filifer]